MRQENKHFTPRFNPTKLFVLSLCLSLVVQTLPVQARSNDDYQTTQFSNNNNYGSSGGYSAAALDLQMQRMNARVQSFVAPPTQFFNSNRLSAPQLNLTYQPPIRFQYTPQIKTTEPTVQPVVKAETFAPIAKPTFVQEIGQAFKSVGAALVSVFRAIGDGIVHIAQKIFGTNAPPVAVTPPAQPLTEKFKNLTEIAPGLLETQNRKIQALGQTWEPGSRFKAEGDHLRLIEGTAYDRNFGGITKADGGLLPIRYADDDGKVKAVGLDFNLLPKDTVLKIAAPVNVEGFGKIMGGEMVFKGTVKTREGGTVGQFQFQGAHVNLDSAMSSVLHMTSPVALLRATFVVEAASLSETGTGGGRAADAAMMNLKSAVVEKGDQRIYISDTHAPLEISRLEQGVQSLDIASASTIDRISRTERDLTIRSQAVSQFFKNAAQQTGLAATINFEFKDDFKQMSQEAGDIRQGALSLKAAVDTEDYDHIKAPLQNLEQRQTSLSQHAAPFKAQAETFRELQRGLRSVTNEMVSLLPSVDATRLKTDSPLTDQELSFRTTKYFPEEKAKISQQTDRVLTGIKGLVETGAMTPDQGALLGAHVMAMRDRMLGAVPNDALFDQKRAIADPLQKTYDTSKSLVNRGADAAFFGWMGQVAERHPTLGVTVGTVGLRTAQTADIANKAIGIVGLVYFGVTATITTVAAVGTAYAAQQALEHVGVNEEASTAYAAITSMLVAAKVGSNPTVGAKETEITQAALAKLESSWQAMKSLYGGMKGIVSNEHGNILVSGQSASASMQSADYIYDVRTDRHRVLESGKFVSPKDMPYPKGFGFKYHVDAELVPGKVIDRYGKITGRFAGEPGASISERGLPPGTENVEYHIFEVIKPIKVQMGPAAEVRAFNAKGGANQYLFTRPIFDLMREGYLREIQ